MRMKLLLVLTALTACGAPAFTTAPDAFDRFDAAPEVASFDAGAPDAQSPDAQSEAAADAGPDSGGAEAGVLPDADGGGLDGGALLDTAQPDAPDAPLEAATPDAPTCTPLPPRDAGAPGLTCGIGSAPSPTFFLVLTPDNGCQWQPTPPACLCAETFNCACLLAQPAPCVGQESCAENGPSQGGPTVSCK